MAEWLKAHAWKACLGETLTRVRIPVSPPPVQLFGEVTIYLPDVSTLPANATHPPSFLDADVRPVSRGRRVLQTETK
jgi:hypothetical protein